MDGVTFPKGDVFSGVMTDGVFCGASRPPKPPLPLRRCRFRGGGGAGRRQGIHRDVSADEDAHAVNFEEGLLSLLSEGKSGVIGI